MFVNVDKVKSGINCEIIGWGHTDKNDEGFRVITQEQFIREEMSPAGRYAICGCKPTDQEIRGIAKKWESQTFITERIFFSGTTAELGVIAAEKCLAHADIRPEEIDCIIGATNTGPGYPSLADHVKLALGQESSAMAFDMHEACTIGSIALFDAWAKIRSGACRKVLVVCAEKATELTGPDNWRGSNLFGDAAFAVLLSASDKESFVLFDFHSLPFNGQIDMVVKRKDGFYQEGNKVHKFVGSTVVDALVKAVEKAGIDYTSIDHFVPHQPSGKTLNLLVRNLLKNWPGFKGVIHRNVEFTGNTSAASTGSLISSGIHSGKIKKGELVVVVNFGSGLSIGIDAFYA